MAFFDNRRAFGRVLHGSGLYPGQRPTIYFNLWRFCKLHGQAEAFCLEKKRKMSCKNICPNHNQTF